jgi:zinc protease
MRRLSVLFLAVLLAAAACTDSVATDDAAETSQAPATDATTETADTTPSDGLPYALIEPDPDPTPIEPGDDVRIGTLDNGLTYYVRENSAPGGSLSLRLVVDAGSLQQEVAESGSAHFLEHMLFNGTENFPGNELSRALERLGVQFGADLNAYTSLDETVYQLDIVSLTDDKVETGFDVLLDWASAATIDQAATEAERGVVREELRLRDEGPEGAIGAVFNDAYLRGTPYEDREPGGRAELVLETNADELRRFYDRWYRPELIAIVAVGDLPADRLEEEIVDRFSSFEGRGDDAGEGVEVVTDPIGTPIVDVVTHPELARRFASIDFSLTSWDESTVGGEELSLQQELMALMIGNRLRDAVDRGDVVLDEPFVTRFDENRAQTFLGFNFDAPDLAAGTEYVLTELRRIELGGFSDAEYERAAQQIRTALDQALASVDSTQDRTYADVYAGHFLSGDQISSLADTHERLTNALDEGSASDVTDLFRWELSRAAPIVIAVGPDLSALPSVDELAAAVEAAGAAPIDGNQRADDVSIEALMARPEPVEPVETSTIDELGADEWVFGNGVTVRFFESDIDANVVNLVAMGEGGWSTLPAGEGALAPYAVAAVGDSGLGDYDRLTVRRFLDGSTAGLGPYIDETSEGFFGSAGSDDLETLFQQLHLSVVAPRISDVSLSETITSAQDQARRVSGDAGTAAINEVADARFDGDERFLLVPPPLDDLTAEAALDIYTERLGTVDDLTVAIAGDVDRVTVQELAEAYLGTLPAGDADSWVDVRPELVADAVRRDVVAGSGTATGTVAVLYPSEFEVDARTRVELRVLEQVFDGRLLDVVREELGASYGGRAVTEATVAPREGVDVLLFANIDPLRADEILDVIIAEADDLATNGPTAEELDRARSVVRADFDLVNNPQLIEMMLTPPDEEILTLERRGGFLADITEDRIRELAALVFPTGTRVEAIALPG